MPDKSQPQKPLIEVLDSKTVSPELNDVPDKDDGAKKPTELQKPKASSKKQKLIEEMKKKKEPTSGED